jgi:predicted GTPase
VVVPPSPLPHPSSSTVLAGYHYFSTTTTSTTGRSGDEDTKGEKSIFSTPKSTGTTTTTTTTAGGGNDNTTTLGLYRLLNTKQRELLHQQRHLVTSVRQLAYEVGIDTSRFPWLSPPTSSHGVDGGGGTNSSSRILEESAFCIVLAGEFNAGKSTIANALLGANRLETGALPTTDAITIVSAHPPPPSFQSSQSSVVYHQCPDVDLLQDLTLVDTPGTNSTLLDHTATTLRLLPSADLILFCTSADRPIPESERQLLATMATDYRKQIVVLINKIDLLRATGGHYGQVEIQRVVDFVTEHVQPWLGVQPLVFPISAADALAVKVNHPGRDPTTYPLWERSQFAPLETFLRTNLTTRSKLQAKLANPVGLAENVLDECLRSLDQQRSELRDDMATLRLLESQVQGWQKELERQMQQTKHDIRVSWQQEANRASVLLRRLTLFEYLQITLLYPTQLDRHWEETTSLVKQLSWSNPESVQTWIDTTAEHLAIQSRAQGQALMEFLGTRPSHGKSNQSLVGHVLAASRFEELRETLTQQLKQAVHPQNRVQNHQTTGQQLMTQMCQLTQVSLGLQACGILVGLATSASWFPVMTGTGMSSILLGLGTVVLWQGRHAVVNNYSDGWTRWGKALEEDLEQISAQTVTKIQRRIQDGIAPYQNFVQVEQDRIDNLVSKCQDAQGVARQLRNQIKKL